MTFGRFVWRVWLVFWACVLFWGLSALGLCATLVLDIPDSCAPAVVLAPPHDVHLKLRGKVAVQMAAPCHGDTVRIYYRGKDRWLVCGDAPNPFLYPPLPGRVKHLRIRC